ERIGDLKIKLRQVLSASRPFSAVGNLVKLSIVRLKKAVERLIPRKNRASDVRTAASSIRSKRLIFSGRRKILAWLLSEPGRNSLKVSPAIKRANRPIRSYAIKRLKRALRRRSLREERQQRFEQTILNFFFNLALLKRRGYVISLSRFGAYHAGRSQRRGAKRGTVLPNTRKNVMRHKEHKDH
ncbi:MAG: hypothetical protein DCC75_10860, partial [Proteobacteria bacterium]